MNCDGQDPCSASNRRLGLCFLDACERIELEKQAEGGEKEGKV